jgi:hypothetical protein
MTESQSPIDTLERAYAAIPRPGSPSWTEVAARFIGVPDDVVRSFIESFLIVPLVSAVSNLPEFSQGLSYSLRYPGGERAMDAALAATMLFRFVNAGGTMHNGLDALREATRPRDVHGQFVMVVAGINISSAADVTEMIRLVPFNDLPRTPSWNDAARYAGATLLPHGMSTLPLPLAALVARVTVSDPVATTATSGSYVTVGASSEIRSTLEEIRLALTCVGPSRPVSVVEWFEFVDPLLSHLNSPGGMSMTYDDLRHGYPWMEVQHESADMAAVARQYSQLADGGTRARLARALRRLNFAMRRADVGDRAVELAIALESVLVGGRGENTFKVSLRASLIIPADRARRIAARAIVSAIYDVRSAVVHSGEAANKVRVRGRGEVSTATVVNEGLVITADVLRQLIGRGAIPVWEDLEVP